VTDSTVPKALSGRLSLTLRKKMDRSIPREDIFPSELSEFFAKPEFFTPILMISE
jgi:hypothetical protein